MIVNCPACSTRYLIEPAALGPMGRVVRCAKCEHSWHQGPPSDMPHQVDVAMPAAARPPASARPIRSAGGSLGAGLPLLILVLLGLGIAGGYFFRERIVAEWPKTAPFYELIGLPTKVLGAGLELVNVNFKRQEVAGRKIIQVQGDIFNKTGANIVLPAIKVALNDDSGKVLYDWILSLAQPVIRPGETVNFQTEAKDPPAEATKLTVTFAAGN
jgi:predicted Zn finger-like uncharacterized protein